MTKTKHLLQIQENLITFFSEEEFRHFCFGLNCEYDHLGGRSFPDKSLDFVKRMDRNGRLPELLSQLKETRPHVTWTYRTNIFISYKRYTTVDKQLALFLHSYLTSLGHQVFIDQTMRTGTDWLEEIDRQIKQADYVLVLISEQSANSEMVQAELIRAYKYRQHQGRPDLLPVRVAYEAMLPYTIDAFLSQIQYILWESENDNKRIAQEIESVINGQPIHQKSFAFERVAEVQILSEDGRRVFDDDTHAEPLPEFDPRILKRLAVPGGAVTLRDNLYIERKADAILKEKIIDLGTTTTIRAPRQTGKTSLLMRGIQHASQNDISVVFLDLQSMGSDKFSSPDMFMREVAETFCHDLRLDTSMVESAWGGTLGAQNKLTYFLEDKILPRLENPIVLAIDEADALLKTDFHQDFFGLLRSWHNRRAKLEEWNLLNLVLVISTEPYLLIDDVTQSPFNVSLLLELTDFSEKQVRHLNIQHGSPVLDKEIPELMKLLNGHPFLTRRLLYALVKDRVTWKEMIRIAAQDNGPFSDHLRRNMWELQQRPELKVALVDIIKQGRSTNDQAVFRLLRAGLIKGSGDSYTFRCDLYQQYFRLKF